MANVLITGASGFIGRRLAPLLVEEHGKDSVHCLSCSLDSLHEAAGQRVLDARGIPHRKVDLLTPASLEGLPRGFSVIIHLAASTDTSTDDFSSNDGGTRNLLAALGPLGKDCHFIYISTAAVYTGRSGLARPVTDATPVSPTNEYGRSKVRAEAIMKAAAERDGFRLTIIRLNTVYGPIPRPNSILDVLQVQVANDSLAARLNWPGLVSITHVDDVAARLQLLASRPAPEQVRTVTFSSEAITLAGMFEHIYRVVGKPYKPLPIPRLLWHALSFDLGLARHLGFAIPTALYNVIWRANLVAGNVLYCESDADKIGWTRKDRTFADSIAEIVASGKEV